jgi:hypothetical protein
MVSDEHGSVLLRMRRKDAGDRLLRFELGFALSETAIGKSERGILQASTSKSAPASFRDLKNGKRKLRENAKGQRVQTYADDCRRLGISLVLSDSRAGHCDIDIRTRKSDILCDSCGASLPGSAQIVIKSGNMERHTVVEVRVLVHVWGMISKLLD